MNNIENPGKGVATQNTELLTQSEIAGKLGVTQAAISMQMDKLGLEPVSVGAKNLKLYDMSQFLVLRQQQQQLKLENEEKRAISAASKVPDSLVPYKIEQLSADQKYAAMLMLGNSLLNETKNKDAIIAEKDATIRKLKYEAHEWQSAMQILKEHGEGRLGKYASNGNALLSKDFVNFALTHGHGRDQRTEQGCKFPYYVYHIDDIGLFLGKDLI